MNGSKQRRGLATQLQCPTTILLSSPAIATKGKNGSKAGRRRGTRSKSRNQEALVV
ncbi:hypothetical protein Lser_V15G03695 [Lactuca serriola]